MLPRSLLSQLAIFLFWTILICATAYLIIWSPREIPTWLPLIVSAIALWATIYPKFLQGPRLVAGVNQVMIIGLTKTDQNRLINDLAVRDLLSPNPSSSAQEVLNKSPQLQPLVAANDFDQLTAQFTRAPAITFGYVPSDEIILKNLTDPRATPSFFIPVDIANVGGNFGQVGAVFATFEHADAKPKQVWAFAAYFEVDPKVISNPTKQSNDMDKFAGTFPGCTLEPGKSVRCNLHFVAHQEPSNGVASKSNLRPGDYRVRLVGFDSRGKRVFESVAIKYPLDNSTLLYAFKGSDWAYFPRIQENLESAVASRRWWERLLG